MSKQAIVRSDEATQRAVLQATARVLAQPTQRRAPGMDPAAEDVATQGAVFVLVKWVGGAAGNRTTYCSWTYDLYPLGDTGYTAKLNQAGALQPENSPARVLKVAVTKASDGTTGLAYYGADGAIRLYSCCEKMSQLNC